MTDSEVRLVQQEVVRFLRRHAYSLKSPKDMEKIFQRDTMETLIDGAKSRLSEQFHRVPTEDDLRVVLSMLLLGPQNAGSPPEAMRTELLDLLRNSGLDPQEQCNRVMEFAVAYGAGWVRTVSPWDDGGWEHYWSAALEQVTQYVYGWMLHVHNWLTWVIQLGGYALRAWPTIGDAELLARHLWLGTCACWRLRFEDADTVPEVPPDHNAAQRAKRCLREHNLFAWNPAKATLWNFIATAVKGVKAEGNSSAHILLGALMQGIICHYLRVYGVHLANVLIWHCPDHPQKQRFLDVRCNACQAKFNEATIKINISRWLIVTAPRGRHIDKQYRRCPRCKNYYEAELTACPWNGCRQPCRRNTTRTTKVWVLGPPPPPPPNEDPPPDKDRTKHLQEALNTLEPIERKIVCMHFYGDKSVQEIADELNLSQDEVQSCLERALEQLKTELSDQEN